MKSSTRSRFFVSSTGAAHGAAAGWMRPCFGASKPKNGIWWTIKVRVLLVSRGELNEGKLVLNREKHPIFDTTNCVQGTYVM
jgi:hypothetical protein